MATQAKSPVVPGARASASGARPFLIATNVDRGIEADQKQLWIAGIVDEIVEREGEDAHITGMTRSLSRRLLALNLRHPTVRVEAVPADSSRSSLHPRTA